MERALRHLHFRVHLDRKSGAHLGRSHPAGVRGDVHLPAKLPLHPDSHHRRADFAAGRVRLPAISGHVDQRIDHVRHGAGDRYCGGRRDCGGGKRRAHHVGRRAATERSHQKGHEPDFRRGSRYYRRAGFRVRAAAVLLGRAGQNLHPVCRHHGDSHRLLGLLRPFAHPRIVRHAAQTDPQRPPCREKRLLRLVQPHVQQRHARL